MHLRQLLLYDEAYPCPQTSLLDLAPIEHSQIFGKCSKELSGVVSCYKDQKKHHHFVAGDHRCQVQRCYHWHSGLLRTQGLKCSTRMCLVLISIIFALLCHYYVWMWSILNKFFYAILQHLFWSNLPVDQKKIHTPLQLRPY